MTLSHFFLNLFMTGSWHAHDLYIWALLLHDLFTIGSQIVYDSLTTCPWLVHNLFTTLTIISWHVHILFQTWLRIFHHFVTIVLKLVHNLSTTFYMTCSKLVPYLLVSCPWLVYNLFTINSWLVQQTQRNLLLYKYATCTWIQNSRKLKP